MQSNFGFTRWNFQFEIDGKTTLDPGKDAGLLKRIASRQSLFMDPLIKSGFLKGKRVLDLGCNSGYWSLLPVRDGGAAFVQGVDAFAELVDQARFVFEKAGIDREKYSFEVGDAYEFLENASPGEFDVILCLGFFYHINDPMRLLSLMSKKSRGFVVIDTVVHNSDEALISVRPVQRKPNYVEVANIPLELVSSPKAIAWMAEASGYTAVRTLSGHFAGIQSMWDYTRGERSCFVLSKGPIIEDVWQNAVDPGFLTIQQDLRTHGYFPEMSKEGRNRSQPLIPRAG